MTERIESKLDEIEKEQQVKILFAVESGSRAWGFASPDSDYDVRFVYVRHMQEYLKLERKRDVIEWQLDELLDINGWDLQKALRLLHASNPTVFEWASSPIVYRKMPEWEMVSDVLGNYFSLKAGAYHYLNMAVGNYREYLKGDIVRLKKYFYVIRPILACKWILDKKTAPPMLFTDLVQAELEEKYQPIIMELLDRKIHLPEIGCAPKIDILNRYIEEQIEEIKVLVSSVQPEPHLEYDLLNKIFCSVLNHERYS